MSQLIRLLFCALIISSIIPRLTFAEETDQSENDQTGKRNGDKTKSDATDEENQTDEKNDQLTKTSDRDEKKEKSKEIDDGKLEIIDDIIKPKRDPKTYRMLIMENKMKVLLISDPDADIALSSVAVDAGGIQSPKEVLGLAHLIEHSIFLGTKEYPGTKFDKYLSDNGGSTNAATAPSQTNYYFSINYDSLEGAIDRFSKMFISPLFDEKAILNEIKVINDEYEISLQNDETRYQRVQQETCSPDHDFHKYYAGDTRTLKETPEKEGLDISEECKKFFETYYSSNNMAGSIYGKGSIKELQKMAVTYFGEIPNRNADTPIYKTSPFTDEQLRKLIYIVPLENTDELHIGFPIPDPNTDYLATPIDYIDYFLQNEGIGSLYSLLTDEGWITDVSTSASVIGKYIAVYEITFQLTETGLDNIDSILVHLFEYINLIKSEGVQESYYEEIQIVKDNDFEWSFKDDVFDQFVFVSRDLLNYEDAKNVLIADKVPLKWESDTINKYLEVLTPDNFRVTAVSQTYESVCDKTEEFFGVKYTVQDIQPDLLEKLQSVSENSKLSLPEPNKYITKNLKLIPLGDEVSEYPVIVYDEKVCRAWLKQDTEYESPNIYMSARFLGPTFGSDSKEVILTITFTFLWYSSIEQIVYPASYAGYTWNVYSVIDGLELYINGYNDKFSVFTKTIMSSMMNFTYTNDMFEDAKEQVAWSLTSSRDAYDIVFDYLSLILEQSNYSNEDESKTLSDITKKDMEDYRKNAFNSIFVHMFIYGNVDEEGAINIAEIVEEPFKDDSEIPSSDEIPPPRNTYLTEGKTYLYSEHVATTNSSAVLIYYQCGEESIRNIVLADLFSGIVETALFEELRTQEQLGYIINNDVILKYGVQGFYISIQSSSFSPEYLHCKIDEFVDNMTENQITRKEFKELKETTKESYLMSAGDMSSQFDEYYGQITRRTYNFALNEERAEELENVKFEDMLEFYSTYVKSNAENRAKLVIYVAPEKKTLDNPNDCQPSDEEIEEIDDINKFKESMNVADVPNTTAEDVPPIGTQNKNKTSEKDNAPNEADDKKSETKEKNSETKSTQTPEE